MYRCQFKCHSHIPLLCKTNKSNTTFTPFKSPSLILKLFKLWYRTYVRGSQTGNLDNIYFPFLVVIYRVKKPLIPFSRNYPHIVTQSSGFNVSSVPWRNRARMLPSYFTTARQVYGYVANFAHNHKFQLKHPSQDVLSVITPCKYHVNFCRQ